MNYSKPSVSVALKKLKASGFIEVNDDGIITLTEEGEKKAFNIFFIFNTSQ